VPSAKSIRTVFIPKNWKEKMERAKIRQELKQELESEGSRQRKRDSKHYAKEALKDESH
jgi:hypothetical protein